MSLTAVFSDTDLGQAKLLSQLSGKPAKVQDDVFIWNGHMIDRATAVVALLKINNQVPVGDNVKIRLHEQYDRRFSQYRDTEDLVGVEGEDPPQSARIWFNISSLCITARVPACAGRTHGALLPMRSDTQLG